MWYTESRNFKIFNLFHRIDSRWQDTPMFKLTLCTLYLLIECEYAWTVIHILTRKTKEIKISNTFTIGWAINSYKSGYQDIYSIQKLQLTKWNFSYELKKLSVKWSASMFITFKRVALNLTELYNFLTQNQDVLTLSNYRSIKIRINFINSIRYMNDTFLWLWILSYYLF